MLKKTNGYMYTGTNHQLLPILKQRIHLLSKFVNMNTTSVKIHKKKFFLELKIDLATLNTRSSFNKK